MITKKYPSIWSPISGFIGNSGASPLVIMLISSFTYPLGHDMFCFAGAYSIAHLW